ncbi:NAD(P)-dependent oxidoreductase [Candidatus Uhrbacteria bacterium]|nr:NAD(P)-dependent oxidoreductase [Candidatus Uhrbacteria bacterium]
MAILVTGAGGFIGSHLVRRLLHLDHDVHILARPESMLERIGDLLPRIKRHDGDMNDEEGIKRCIGKAQPDGIFHLAASNIQTGKRASDEDVVTTNILGMAKLLSVTKELPYSFLIHAGSFLEYGMKMQPMTETDVCEPAELYSLSKLAATLLAAAAGRTSKKPTLTFRIFTPYGANMQRGRIIEQIIRCSLHNEDIPLTQPTVTRDFLYVGDIVDLLIEGMEKAKTHAGEIFNAGSGQSTTLQTIVDEVFAQTKSTSIVRWNSFPPVLYDTATCQAEMSKTFAAFRWRPAHTLAEGLSETITSFQS